MKKINKSHLFLWGLLLTILPYCYLSFFTNPCVDDFSLSAQAQQNDLLELVSFQYFFRSGRYFSNLLIFLNPIAFGSFFAYKIAALCMLVFVFFSNFLMVKQLFYSKTSLSNVIISLVLSLLFIQNMPIISEGIYWFTGVVIYTLGVTFVLLYVALFFKVVRENKQGAYSILLIILLFFSCGFNEVLTFLIVFFLGIATFIFHRNKLAGKRLIRTNFIFSICFLAIVIFSPGNEIRGGAYQNTHQFLYSMLFSVMQVGRFTLVWTTSIPLIAASFLYFHINKKMYNQQKLFNNSFYMNRWITLLLLFLIIFIGVFPAYWSTGILGQHRTLNIAYFFFLVMWFINLTAWLNYYKTKLRVGFTNKIKIGLSIFLLVGFLATNNGYNALEVIFLGTAKEYNKELTERFKILKNAQNTQSRLVELPELKARPKCLFVSEITNNPNNWTNQAYNLYFHINEKKIFCYKQRIKAFD